MISLNSFADHYDILLSKYEERRRQENNIVNYESMAFKNSTKRVISCMVNELLVSSRLVQIPKKLSINYLDDTFWIVLYANSNVNHVIWAPINIELTEQNINFDLKAGIIKLLDPNDVGGIVFISEIKNEFIHFESVTNLQQIFAVIKNEVNACKVDAIINEVNNSINHQVLAYKENKPFVPLWRPTIEYEQSIVEGHHTHPMNKSRVPVNEITVDLALYDFNKIKIHFYIVPKSAMNIYGDYENIMEIMAKKFGILYNRETETIIPVHELQTKVVNTYFGNAELQESTTSINAFSQSSLRSVNIDNVLDYSFKLALGVVITSAMRTITHWTTYQGVYLRPVLEKIIENNEILTVLEELGSITVKNDDFDVSKHLGCIIRENVNVKLSHPFETAIVCAYLTEKCGTEYNITKLFDLKDQTDRDNFSCLYAKLLIDAFFGMVYKYGFAFEAHQQNVLLRVRKNAEHGYNLLGFIVRGLGGIKVHQETLRSKIGITVSVLDDNAICLADNLESVYLVCHHTLFHSHLQQIFKSLGTHDNGKGWRFVRQHLKSKKLFLENERCVEFFFAKMVSLKCFMKMKLNDYDREYFDTDVPNVINFNGI